MEYSLDMKSLPSSERPYERFHKLGAAALTDSELIAIIIGSGSQGKNAVHTANEIIAKYTSNGRLDSLQRASVEELIQIKGIGFNKAIRILAAFELANRSKLDPLPDRLNCSNPTDIVKHFAPKMEDLEREELRALFLNRKNLLIKDKVISTGGLSSTVIYPRDVFKEALKANAACLILLHNHPSGNPTPSNDDLSTTKVFVEASKILGIKLHDHIIVGKNKFISLASEERYNQMFF